MPHGGIKGTVSVSFPVVQLRILFGSGQSMTSSVTDVV